MVHIFDVARDILDTIGGFFPTTKPSKKHVFMVIDFYSLFLCQIFPNAAWAATLASMMDERVPSFAASRACSMTLRKADKSKGCGESLRKSW
jgi:hypothetical protein